MSIEAEVYTLSTDLWRRIQTETLNIIEMPAYIQKRSCLFVNGALLCLNLVKASIGSTRL